MYQIYTFMRFFRVWTNGFDILGFLLMIVFCLFLKLDNWFNSWFFGYCITVFFHVLDNVCLFYQNENLIYYLGWFIALHLVLVLCFYCKFAVKESIFATYVNVKLIFFYCFLVTGMIIYDVFFVLMADECWKTYEDGWCCPHRWKG